MPRRKPPPLPQPLQYLQRFVNALAKFRPDDLNEDVDGGPLELLVRQRIDGLNLKTARAAIKADRNQLETWLRELGDGMHPAYWVLGYLSAPRLVDELRAPPEPDPVWPVITFDAPPGWKTEAAQNTIGLRKGKLVGQIVVIDEMSFLILQKQHDVPVRSALEVRQQQSDVVFGSCTGRKYVMEHVGKRVDYLLRVPDGFVDVMVDSLKSGFDESELESRLHTIKVTGAQEFFDSVNMRRR
ncbi:MAG: hypothetical protein JNG89_04595 [Planctomycetaceae bacterium]|nr:hypothetical protein [Planctomycetaceae bacterium]